MHPVKTVATTKNVDPQVMTWDTEFWGFRVGRATKLDGLSEWAAENTIGLVCLLAGNVAEVQQAEERGFRLMDVRVTLERPTTMKASGARLARAEDTSRLREIARTAYTLTRFYADPHLDDDRCGDLYSEWTRALCAGGADVVLVVDRSGFPAGYVTVDLDETGAGSSIGLIAVKDELRATGIGATLVNGALDFACAHEAKTMRVVTQGANTGALRTFEACGFRIVRAQFWLHKWYD